MGLLKIQNLEHKYRATRAQLPRNKNGTQSSIKIRHIPLKDIDNQTWRLVKGPWKDSHDPRPRMSPHTYIILLSKLAKKDKNEEIWGIVYVK
jgi:hypothetical protein